MEIRAGSLLPASTSVFQWLKPLCCSARQCWDQVILHSARLFYMPKSLWPTETLVDKSHLACVSGLCLRCLFLKACFLPLSSLKRPNPGIFVRGLLQIIHAFGCWFSPWSHARGAVCLLHLWQTSTVRWAAVLSFSLCFHREVLSVGAA